MIILYVDDDNEDQELFCEAIRAINDKYICITAKDGLKALEILSDLRTSGKRLPDIIFLDNNMPVMNGLECLLQLKVDQHFSQIPVMVYSTSSRVTDINQFLAAGAKGYIMKHNGFNQLKKMLVKVLIDKEA